MLAVAVSKDAALNAPPRMTRDKVITKPFLRPILSATSPKPESGKRNR